MGEGKGRAGFQWRQKSRRHIDLDGILQWYSAKWQEIKGIISTLGYIFEKINCSAFSGVDKAIPSYACNIWKGNQGSRVAE